MATNALFWPPEREVELRKLWDQKLSCRTIAGYLGVSRNAVIGKAHRMGLEPREKVIAKPREARPRKRGLHTRHRRDVLGKLFAPDPVHIREVNVESRKLTFDQLEASSCRYPDGGGDDPITFCGHEQRAGSSYCPAHHFLCWKPPQSINREEFHLTRLERFRAYKAELVNA